MREPRKRSFIGIAAVCAIALSAFVIGTYLDESPSPSPSTPGDAIGESFRIERRGPIPRSWLAASRSDSTCWVAKSEETGFLTETNASRTGAGKTRLRLDPELSKVARKHTKEMTTSDLLHHTTEDALRRRVTFWSHLGENVGAGATVDSLHAAFMNSPVHRENILDGTYRHVGIGTASASGRLWVTVIFQSEDNPGTTLRMPRC